MANISDLPADLKEHARAMPDGLLQQLHQGEAEHRLRHVDRMLRAAESLQAEPYREATKLAGRIRDAKPNAGYVKERDRLKSLSDDAGRLGHHDLANAYLDSLDRLRDEHPQSPGVQEAIMKWDQANPQVAKAARKAAIQKAIDAELKRVTERYLAECNEIRKEIRALQEQANGQR